MARSLYPVPPVSRSELGLLEDAKLLASLTGDPVGAGALGRVGGLPGLTRLGPGALPISEGGRQRLAAALGLFERLQAASQGRAPSRIRGPADVAQALGPVRRREEVECFWVLGLDARQGLLGIAEVSRGTVSACLVHPRECFVPAMAMRACSVVVAHNHPSQDPEPSPEDLALTERLVAAGRLLGIPVIDHVVVTRFQAQSVPGSRASFLDEAVAGKL